MSCKSYPYFYDLSLLVIYLTSSKQKYNFRPNLKVFLLRGGVKVGLKFYPWNIHRIIHTIPNRIQWKIHGTGIIYLHEYHKNQPFMYVGKYTVYRSSPWIRSGITQPPSPNLRFHDSIVHGHLDLPLMCQSENECSISDI